MAQTNHIYTAVNHILIRELMLDDWTDYFRL